MASIVGRVLEVAQISNDDTRKAYLYGFGVNSAQPKIEHQRWLLENLIGPALARLPTQRDYPSPLDDPRPGKVYPGVPAYRPPAQRWPSVNKGGKLTITTDAGDGPLSRLVFPDKWMIWLHGTASRPGSFKHNWSLSHLRAQTVAEYIRTALLSRSLDYHIDSVWIGEFVPDLLGKREWREDPLDRAVLIAFKPVYPSVTFKLGPPAPSARPCCAEPCCIAKAYIEYLEIVKDSWLNTDISHGVTSPGGLRIDDAGDVPAMGLVPHVQPRKEFMLTRLRNAGYSIDRALEMYNSGLYYVSVPIADGRPDKDKLDASNVVPHINRDLAQERTLLPACTGDVDQICQGSDFAFRKK